MINIKFGILKALLILLAIPFLSLTQNVSAEVGAQESKLQPVSCFDEGMYEFRSVSAVISTENSSLDASYSDGEAVNFEGYIKNNNPYPVVDGYLFARVSSYNDEYLLEGYNIVDEFFVAEKINIDGNSRKSVNFSWNIPENSHSDYYRIDYFFNVDKRFNLGGLSFSNEIIAGYTEFKVDGNSNSIFSVDKTDTKINGEKYNHIGDWKKISSDTYFAAEQPIQNLTNSPLDVDVTYEFYYWDSIKNENLIDTKKETITIDPQSESVLRYENDELDTSVGYLKIIAEAGGLKSIVNMRFVTELTDTRLNYAAVNKFPLSKDDSFKIFTCGYNTVNKTEGNTISLKLKNEKGKIIAEDEYQTDLSTAITGYAMDLTATKDYQFLTLETAIEDADGNLLTSYSVDYDCETLDSDKCIEKIHEEYDNNILLYSIAVVVLLLLFILLIVVTRKRKNGTNNLLMSVLMLALVLSSISLANNLIYKTKIATAQLDGLDSTIQEPDDPVVNGNNTASWSDGTREAYGPFDMTRAMNGKMYYNSGFDPDNAEIGDIFYLTLSEECEYSESGGSWNTPYCGDEVYTFDNDDGENGKINMSDVPYDASIDFSNSDMFSCNEITSNHPSINTIWECTITDSGQSTITTSIAGGDSTMSICVGFDNNTGEVRASSNNLDNSFPRCGGNGTVGTKPKHYIGFDDNNVEDITTLYLGGASFTWNFNVNEPDPIDGECGVSDGKYYPSSFDEDDLHQCDAGQSGEVSFSEGIFSWDCQGEYDGEDISCATREKGSTGDPDDPDNPDALQLGIDCQFTLNENPITSNTDSLINETIVASANIYGEDLQYLDLQGLEYQFTEYFDPESGLIQIDNPNNNQISYSVNQNGIYQVEVDIPTYFGEPIDIEPVMCEGNLDDYVIDPVINIPEITFSIDPEVSNQDGNCTADITIENNGKEAVTCNIVTEDGQVLELENESDELINGFDGTKKVGAGTSYKLKCDLVDEPDEVITNSFDLDTLLETPIDRCVVNPNLQQN